MLSLLVPLAAADSGGLCAGCTIVVGLLLGRSKPVPIPPVALKAICAQKLSIAGIGDASGLCEQPGASRRLGSFKIAGGSDL